MFLDIRAMIKKLSRNTTVVDMMYNTFKRKGSIVGAGGKAAI